MNPHIWLISFTLSATPTAGPNPYAYVIEGPITATACVALKHKWQKIYDYPANKVQMPERETKTLLCHYSLTRPVDDAGKFRLDASVPTWLIVSGNELNAYVEGPTNELGCQALYKEFVGETDSHPSVEESDGVKWKVHGKAVTAVDIRCEQSQTKPELQASLPPWAFKATHSGKTSSTPSWLTASAFGSVIFTEGPTNDLGCEALRNIDPDEMAPMFWMPNDTRSDRWTVHGKPIQSQDVSYKCVYSLTKPKVYGHEPAF